MAQCSSINPSSDQDLIDALNTHYGIQVHMLTSLPLGADMNSYVYKAQAQDQSSYFIKLKRGHHHDLSIIVLELLHHAKIQQIIPPIKTIHGQSTQHINDFTLIVYPFVQGQNAFSYLLTDEQWLTLGKALKQVHELDAPLSIQQQLPQETYSPKWREIVRSLYDHIETNPIGDEIAHNFHAFMKQNLSAIQRLVDRAEQLAQKLQNESPKLVLCHSDLHGGNVLIDQNETIYMVDWDEPIMAPKERDLMFIGGGVGNVWNQPHQEVCFFKGYGKTEINREILTYYRHERIVEDIAIFAQNLLLTTIGGKDRMEMYRHFIDMFEPKGVVEIAFETDQR